MQRSGILTRKISSIPRAGNSLVFLFVKGKIFTCKSNALRKNSLCVVQAGRQVKKVECKITSLTTRIARRTTPPHSTSPSTISRGRDLCETGASHVTQSLTIRVRSTTAPLTAASRGVELQAPSTHLKTTTKRKIQKKTRDRRKGI